MSQASLILLANTTLDEDSLNTIMSDESANITKAGKRGPNIVYYPDEEFNSKQEAEEYIKSDGSHWSYYKNYKTKDGRKYKYRCNRVSYRDHPQCAASVHILAYNNGTKCTVFRSNSMFYNCNISI